MQRNVAIAIEDDADLRQTLESYRIIQQSVSAIAASLGKNPSALKLHQKSYSKVRGVLKAQLTCTAIRSVAAVYAKRARRTTSPIQFNSPRAMFLIGDAKRDAGINKDGTISIWTVGGRKRLKFTIPDRFKATMTAATTYDAVCVAIRNGRIHATLSLTIAAPAATGVLPVGVNVTKSNAIAAVDIHGRSMSVVNAAHQTKIEVGEKMGRRLRSRLTTRKAEGRETRSVRRALKRLSRKRFLQSKEFCNGAAKVLIGWVKPNSVIVLEDRGTRATTKRKGVSVLGTPVFYEILSKRIETKAEEAGIRVAYTAQAETQLGCSRCGEVGKTRAGAFTCAECGLSVATDKNSAMNIRNRFTVFKTVGGSQPAPKLDNG